MKRHEKEFEQFLNDWKTHDKPWELWEFASHPLSLNKVDLDYWDWGNPNSGIWQQMTRSYIACFGLKNYKFRRKPETIIPRGIDLLKPNLQWSKLNYGPMNWEDAVKTCQDLKEGNLTGWRLPTIQELISLINFTKINPASDSDLDLESSFYWSSTTYANYTYYAWLVYFYHGYVYSSNKSNSYYVRAVRTVKQMKVLNTTNIT